MEDKPILKLRPNLMRKSLSFPAKPPSDFKVANPRNLQTLQLIKDVNEGALNVVFWVVNDELRETHLVRNFEVLDVRKLDEGDRLLLCQNKLDGEKSLVRVADLRKILKQSHKKMKETLVRQEIGHFFDLSKQPEIRQFLLEYKTSWVENEAFFLQFSEFPLKTILEYQLSSQALLDISTQISHFLTHLHSQDKALIDFQPENILYDGSKIRFIGLRLTQKAILPPKTEINEGNGRYMAPELLNLPLDIELDLRKCDLYAFGVLLYYLSSGKFPGKGDEETEGIGDQSFRSRVQGLLRKKPEERKLWNE